MKRYSILRELRNGRRVNTEIILVAADKQTALAWAAMRGISGKLLAMEIIDAEVAA